MWLNAPALSAADDALAMAERQGFRLALLGRTTAVLLIAIYCFSVFYPPINYYTGTAVLLLALVGLTPLALVGRRHELAARYAFFAFDMCLISLSIVYVPLSTGDDIPQNLVFITSRTQYYSVAVAVSVLTLSPALVIWTGLWAVAGMIAATLAIMAGMDQISSFTDLPATPSRAAFYGVVFNPNFLGISVRVTEAVQIILLTGIAALAVYRARGVVLARAQADRERGRIQQLFGRYVPPQIAEQLIGTGHLAPQTREASLLFADIEGFTRLSESLPPAEVIALLNEFFTATTHITDQNGGVVISYVGDALIAAFNAPLPVEKYADCAVAAAKAMMQLVETRDFNGHRLRLRIGIATGPVAAGTVGGAERQSYTVYGDAVNLAQRLERLNKEYGTTCLICGNTYGLATSCHAHAVDKGVTQVRGRDQTVQVYALASAS